MLGALVGLEREKQGRAAGLRTHMLVAMGAAMLAIVPSEANPDGAALEEIAKGIAAGVGFLGAGTILKKESQAHIEGLTTAAGIWMTAAVGFAVGAGWLVPAALGTVFALIVLAAVAAVE